MQPPSFFKPSGHEDPKIEAIKKELKKAASETEADPDNQGILQGKSVPNILADVPSVPGQKQLQKVQQAAIQENAPKHKSKLTPGGSKSSSSDDEQDENPPA